LRLGAEADRRLADAPLDCLKEPVPRREDRHRPNDRSAPGQHEQQKKGTARTRSAVGARGHL